MKVELLKKGKKGQIIHTGEIKEIDGAYAVRMIEQGQAVKADEPEEEPKKAKK